MSIPNEPLRPANPLAARYAIFLDTLRQAADEPRIKALVARIVAREPDAEDVTFEIENPRALALLSAIAKSPTIDRETNLGIIAGAEKILADDFAARGVQYLTYSGGQFNPMPQP